jgi:hypothetical protein
MTINDVRGVLKGRVLLPDDDGFEQAATAWNLTVRQPVAAGGGGRGRRGGARAIRTAGGDDGDRVAERAWRLR